MKLKWLFFEHFSIGLETNKSFPSVPRKFSILIDASNAGKSDGKFNGHNIVVLFAYMYVYVCVSRIQVSVSRKFENIL